MIQNRFLVPLDGAKVRIGRVPRRRARRAAGLASALVVAAALLTTAGGQVAAQEPDVVAVPSPGCAVAAPAAGESTRRFDAMGRTGSYIRDVPPGADRPLPLVMDLHGYLEPAALQHRSSGFGPYGTEHGFFTITPQFDEPSLPKWDPTEGSPDIAYLGGLLTEAEATLCVDTRRVFVTGLSMGGFTSSSLGCQLSDRIAAIAPVAGLQDFPWCRTGRPVPVISFHGTADPIVAYEGGTGPNARLLPSPDGSGSAVRDQEDGPRVTGPMQRGIPDQAAGWARRNGCAPDPVERKIADDVILHSYSCQGGGDVQLYSLVGAGHVWPGTKADFYPEPFVGANTTSISATPVIWDFFQAHPLRR